MTSRAHETLGTPPRAAWQDTLVQLQQRGVDTAFRHLVEKMTVVIFTDLADEVFTPIYISPQIETLVGYSQSEWLADPSLWVRSIHPDDRDRVIAAADGGDWDIPYFCEYRLIAKDGSTVWIREETVTIRDAEGVPKLYQGVFIDITAQKTAEARLQETEARYRLLVEQLPAVMYIADVDETGGFRYISPQVQDILGYSAEELVESPHLWFETIHPDDRVETLDKLAGFFRARMPYTLETRNISSDGRVVWLRSEALVVRDASGNPMHWQGILTDVTAQKNAEEALRQLHDKYRHLLDNANDVILTFDTSGRLTYVNNAFRDFTGYSEAEALQMHILDLVHTEDKLQIAAQVDALLRHERVRDEKPFRVATRDGRTLVAESRPSVIEENGKVVGVQAIIRDVTSQQQREQQLAYRAFHDELTGLPNRARFIERLDQYLNQTDRRSDTFAVLFTDLDNFKAVNDALGHAAGDRALVTSANRMQDVLRDHDIVARFGGDEFAILLTNLEAPQEAEVIAERLITALMDPIRISGRDFVLTVSIGITLPNGNRVPSETLLRRADMAMYESKLLGKNQYNLYENRGPMRPTFQRQQTGPLQSNRVADVLLSTVPKPSSD